jgi:hypothetical protein
VATIGELLEEHVTLAVDCLDRLYLNGYVPTLQVPGQLVTFLTKHRGATIPSPALLDRITTQFVQAVRAFADAQQVPLIRFQRGERKDDVATAQRQTFAATGRAEGVVFIGVAQEKAQAFKATKRVQGKAVGFDYSRQPVFVNYYYFYLYDCDFGPAFIKVCSYAPYTIKVYLNGHEWAKQQLTRAGITFEALDNGFLSCTGSVQLQAVCDRLGPPQIRAFFAKWLARLPLPLTPEDRAAGDDYRLSVWQVEVSRTQVFAEPVHGREFFEEVIRENLDLGRPDRIQLLFDRRVQANTPGRFRTRVFQEGVIPSLHVEYKHCHVKQYFKEGRALRTETTINDPTDLGIGKDLSHLPELQQIGREVNRRLLDVQRVSQACTLSHERVEQVVQPTVTEDGHRAPGLRFGQPRTMALLAALVLFLHLPYGLTHRTLRPLVAAYLGLAPDAYTSGQMTYDLRRLRLKGLLVRLPHTQRYQVTTEGHRVALFFTRLHARVFRPGFAAFDPTEPIPRPLADAFAAVNRQIDLLLDSATLAPAA